MTIVIGTGSVARYRVQEQLVALDLPNQVVGQTPDVSGSIAFSATGQVQADRSKITATVRNLKTDSDRRDEYAREKSLESNKFPTAEFVVRQTPGLPWPLPTAGEVSFQLVGDMTMHGVTRPITWDATARFSPDGIGVSGQARTRFTFGTFGMSVPRSFLVLSVEDDLRLEVDFVGSVAGR